MIVSDTNLIVHFTVQSRFTEEAELVYSLDSDWQAPIIWLSEFRNVLWKMMRLKDVSLADALGFIEEASNSVKTFDLPIASETILSLSYAAGLSPYDSEFVALAQELQCPLVTYDQAILKAFPAVAIDPIRFARSFGQV